MSAWHRAHTSLPETLVADLEEDSFTALCGTRATAPQHRSTDKRILLKAINFDFMPDSGAAICNGDVISLVYSERRMALCFTVGDYFYIRRRATCCDAMRDHGPRGCAQPKF